MVNRLRSRALIALGVAGSLVVGAPLAVGATGRGGPSSARHHVEFTRVAVGDPTFSFLTGPNGEGFVSVSGPSTISGDLEGSAFGAGFGTSNDETGIGASGGVSTWTLTASPCGAGTVITTFTGVSGESSGGVWRIVTGAGTGDLVNVRGGGTYVSLPDGTASVGNIRCD